MHSPKHRRPSLPCVSAVDGAPFSRLRPCLSPTDALSFVYTILVAWSCADRACVCVAGRRGRGCRRPAANARLPTASLTYYPGGVCKTAICGNVTTCKGNRLSSIPAMRRVTTYVPGLSKRTPKRLKARGTSKSLPGVICGGRPTVMGPRSGPGGLGMIDIPSALTTSSSTMCG